MPSARHKDVTLPSQVRLCLRTPMLHWAQQLGVDSGQPCQGLSIQPIVFLPTLSNQPHLAGMRHDHLVPQPLQQPADPGRMRPGL